MEEDGELERIKRKKLKQLMKKATEVDTKDKLTLKNPIEVKDTTFQNVIQSYPLVVIDCWAPWCGPCRMVAPVIEELARDYAGKIVFGKLNVDENPNVATQYQIRGIPTLLVFRTGNLIDRIVGAMPRQILEQKLTHYL